MSATRRIALPFPLDLRRSMRPLRLGKHDPTTDLRGSWLALAMRTPDGPASLRAHQQRDAVEVEAWGDGAPWALDHSPALLGLLDDLDGFDPQDELVRRLHRDAPGLRLPRTMRVFDALVPAVLSQRVTGFEAKRSYRLLVERWGEPAPGPMALRLTPSPEVIADIGYYDLHVIGVEKKRADALQRACTQAGRLERLAHTAPEQLRDRLEVIPGLGKWTSAEVARVALGDADAVSVGDYHLKHLVCWALAGEARGSDDRMLELLEPYPGHRGRVCTLIESSGLSAPRYAPRQRVQPMRDR